MAIVSGCQWAAATIVKAEQMETSLRKLNRTCVVFIVGVKKMLCECYVGEKKNVKVTANYPFCKYDTTPSFEILHLQICEFF